MHATERKNNQNAEIPRVDMWDFTCTMYYTMCKYKIYTYYRAYDIDQHLLCLVEKAFEY